MQYNKIIIICICFVLSNSTISAEKVIRLTPTDNKEFALIVNKELEQTDDQKIKIILEKGVYKCFPDYAYEKYCAITNHGNGNKRILFSLKGYQKLQIEGNGATLLCHGRLMPFFVEYCKNITIKNLTINWDIPFTFLGEVVFVNKTEGWKEIKPFTKGFSWILKKDMIFFPNIDGFNYTSLGSTLPFEKTTKKVVDGALDVSSSPTKVEKLKNGNLRIYEKMKYYPPVGSLLSSKGDREHDRYAPAFDFKSCKNIVIDHVTVNHSLGMAFLFERSENIYIFNSNVILPHNSQRVISSTADASHFANCKGFIKIERCRFENMLDDGTNVHGTYVNVDKIINRKTLRIRFMHFEQMGFNFAESGDEIWFILKPSPERSAVGKVKNVKIINEAYSEIEFEDEIPRSISIGDLLENKTWNPSFSMLNCTVRNHRARNLIIKTPLKTVIMNNNFSSMMSAIQLRGDSYFWYESGAVEDVVIKNNRFIDCGNSGLENAILYVTPRLNNEFDDTICFDRNILFENNEIIGSNSRVIWADRVDGLVVKGNKITFNNSFKNLYPNNPIYELINCKNVTIENNKLNGTIPKNIIKTDDKSAKTLQYR